MNRDNREFQLAPYGAGHGGPPAYGNGYGAAPLAPWEQAGGPMGPAAQAPTSETPLRKIHRL